MTAEYTLDTQQIEQIQRMVCNTQQTGNSEEPGVITSSLPSDHAQRTPPSHNFKVPETQSQISTSDSGLTDHGFHYLQDSYPYHAERLNIRSSSQVSDLSPNASLSGPPQMLSTLSGQQGGVQSTPFKVPSFPSISSIRPTKSSDENDSSLNGIGEASPRLSQFFQATQDSPPQVPSSPQFSEIPEQVPLPSASPPLERTPAKHTPVPTHTSRDGRSQVPNPPRELRQEEDDDDNDSFAAIPEHLLRKRAMEERAHQIFENLRTIKIDPAKLKKGRSDSQTDDILFGAPSRLDPDGVRRVIKTVSEGGGLSDDEISGTDSRKRASTAPAREYYKSSISTVISNSQPSNKSVSNDTHDTNGKTVIKETPIEASPASRPQTSHAGGESNQLRPPWPDIPQQDLVTPLRKSHLSHISSSINTPHPPQVLDTPAGKPIITHDSHESVPETSPVKDDATETDDYRTARESFPREEVDSSPPVVHGRARTQGFVASSNPLDGTDYRKRERAPRIHDEISEEEEEEEVEQEQAARRVRNRTKSPPKRRRVGQSTERRDVGVVIPVETQLEGIDHVHRVFARFMDAKMSYYPATVLEPPSVLISGEEASLDAEVSVRFDDDTETTVQLRHIRRFDLQPGDTVKLAMDGMKRTNYIVQRCEHDAEISGRLDIKGNNAVIVSKKSSAEEIRVPLEKVFLTGTLFAQFDKRRYLFTNESSRPRYLPPLSRQVSSSPDISRVIRPQSRLFQNMVFAISLDSSREEERNTFVQSIVANSGHVLVNGLHQMFQSPQDSDGHLVLEPEWTAMTFCAVIASEYSRKVKYLQALGLGVPCLSLRWVNSCIKQQRIMDWRAFLLPAGESSFLEGVKSMVVDPFLPNETLSERLERRRMPLLDQKILMIVGKGKEKAESKRHYHFILHAMGSKEVFCCSTISEADQFLSQGGYTMIIAEEADIKRWGERSGIKIYSYEFIVQTLILGGFPDDF